MEKICKDCKTVIKEEYETGRFAGTASIYVNTEITIDNEPCQSCTKSIQSLLNKYCNDERLINAVNDNVRDDYDVYSIKFEAHIVAKKI